MPWGHEAPDVLGVRANFSGGSREYMERGSQEVKLVGEGLGILTCSLLCLCYATGAEFYPNLHPISDCWYGCLASWPPSLLTFIEDRKLISTYLWTCDYVRLHGKGEWRLQMEVSLQIHWLENEELTLDYMNGPNVITKVPKSRRKRTRKMVAWEELDLKTEEGVGEPRQPLEGIKGKKTSFPLESPGEMQPDSHLHSSPVRCFWPPEL